MSTPHIPSPDPLVRTTQTLLLDSQIRDWVVLPLLVIMIAAGLLRAHVGRLLRPAPKPTPSMNARAKSALMRSSRLRGGAGGFLSGGRWEARRLAWSANDGSSPNGNTGWLRQEATRAETDKKIQDAIQTQNGGDDANANDPLASALPPGMDPSAMMDGMKGNMAAMVQNMVMMQGISHFFRGFVLVKVPFPLTRGFKQMFQRGLFDLTTLDTSYVSSVSWYFLVMFGLRAFFRLAMGDPLQEEMEGNEIQKELGRDQGGGGPPGAFDGPKILRAEADNLELINVRSRRFKIDEAEKNLLGKRYPKKKLSKKGYSGEDVLFGLSSGKNKSLASSKQKKSKAAPSLAKED
mmetsp:Transcript_8289/g.18582  ORF Transcript_8289/g.18582 Transcript_8289/m.18582 type:complete len:349 (-) Transcript_8289:104-1150(-)|eukprot:CAMPEP_0172322994 /NCGR_PEP_ID=MMETSP1058-20130122/47521_1 /TAXON_ID=83371 /ORGANISM="Detonula confervacea, Strain CCMP 353" /LENGTH=348 /DNA_ID=CAMNT_0013038887 /DNA_START=126 /DNA_END=1172 /DNA_ORIENTATION=-